MASTYHLTPSLIIGDAPWPTAVPVKTALEATDVIICGGDAVLPDTDEGWAAGRRALALLGLTNEQVAMREAFAKTGRLS